MLWRMIIRAAPTCTLWAPDFNRDVLRFRPWPSLVITYAEYMEVN